MPTRAVSRTKELILLVVLALTLAFAVSLYANLEQVGSQYEDLAKEVGRTFFQALTTMRDWNFRHQGLYLPVSADVQPNADLVDPSRDITSTTGMKLTKINHSQMIRMIGEELDRRNGVHIHITSATPIRRQNAPDSWESKALSDFAMRKTEAWELQGMGKDKPTFRYMAPLKAEDSCLSCHHEHKGVDEIRGGISVSFSYQPFQQLLDRSNRRIYLLHIFAWMACLIPITYLGRGLVQKVGALQTSLERVRQLEGLVPICAGCKKIRPDGADAAVQSSWIPVEKYIEDRTNAEFTHGLCPECRHKFYPGLVPEKRTSRTEARL